MPTPTLLLLLPSAALPCRVDLRRPLCTLSCTLRIGRRCRGAMHHPPSQREPPDTWRMVRLYAQHTLSCLSYSPWLWYRPHTIPLTPLSLSLLQVRRRYELALGPHLLPSDERRLHRSHEPTDGVRWRVASLDARFVRLRVAQRSTPPADRVAQRPRRGEGWFWRAAHLWPG